MSPYIYPGLPKKKRYRPKILSIIMLSLILITIIILSSCRIYKIDSKGNRVETTNTKLFLKGHPNGYYSKGKWHPIKRDTSIARY